jgi:hypothetical protein
MSLLNELNNELNRVELELIRKELKRLLEKDGLSQETEDQIDRLRGRLRIARERLGGGGQTNILTAPPFPPAPPPFLPAPPVAPAPHEPVPRELR